MMARISALIVLYLAANACAATTSFDPGWRFFKGEAKGAEAAAFDDSAWRTIDLPHDWSIEGPYDRANPTGISGGFLPAGVGWYRKHFVLPQEDAGNRIFVQFDGVMANSDVWINGVEIGGHPYGYTPFLKALTNLNYGGADNVLAVRCDNSLQPASRFYTGAGIYRHVRLIVDSAIYIQPGSMAVRTENVSAASADVSLSLYVVNETAALANATFAATLIGPHNQTHVVVATGAIRLPARGEALHKLGFNVTRPALWDIDHPAMYQLAVEVRDEKGKMLCAESVPFGIRSFEFKADSGFWLNGKNIKLLGACMHDDGGAVGMAVPLGVWEKRLASLKSVGFNAIRTAHNPPSADFLDLCDQMGFVVMDEFFDCWSQPKTNLSEQDLQDYHLSFKDWWKRDVTATVARDRNHPCVMLWSAGNEIHDLSDPKLATEELLGIRDLIHGVDPTRPVTMAVFRPNVYHAYDNGFSDLLDVVGQNYRENELAKAHQDKPARKILGTENRKDPAAWRALRDDPANAGQFYWTGFDYLGEARAWPTIENTAGAFDRTNFAKPQAYQLASWWTSKPMVYMARILPALAGNQADGDRPDPRHFADWTIREANPPTVNLNVYSNCEEVELLLNGKSLGVKKLPADASPYDWRVAYEAGTIVAVGRAGGKEIVREELHTAGAPAKLQLQSDLQALPPDWDDVAYVRATVLDAEGNVVPDAAEAVKFAISGPGIISAVDNGDSKNAEPYQAAQRHLYNGTCIALVKASAGEGTITVTATCAGIPAATATIEAAAGR